MDNNNNNVFQSNLRKEEIENIKNAARFLRTLIRIKNGFLQMLTNAPKLFIALLYIVGVTQLWLHREPIIGLIYSGYETVIATVYYVLFTWVLPILAVPIFIIILMLFGIVFHYGNKLVNACISARIFTGAGKPPWLLSRYKDKKDRVYTVWEIFLNGNEENDFITKKKKLESELGVNIHRFQMKGTRTLLLYTTPENTKSHKANRSDLNY